MECVMEKLLTIKEAAYLLKRTVEAVRKLDQRGKLNRANSPDRSVRYTESEVRKFMAPRDRIRLVQSLGSSGQSV